MNKFTTPLTKRISLNLLMCFCWSLAFSQQFTSVHQITAGTGSSSASSIATDGYGNSFILGRFDNILKIGDSTFVGDSQGNIFLSKFNSSGQFLWAKHFNGPNQDAPGIVHADREGNCYIVNGGSGLVNLGDTTLELGIDGLYLAKHSPEGRRLWVQQIQPGVRAWLSDFHIDPTGNCYISGGANSGDFFD